MSARAGTTKKTTRTKTPHARPILPAEYAAHWPCERLPLALWGLHGERTVLPIALKPWRFSDFLARPWRDLSQGPSLIPRWIGLISYDEFCLDASYKLPSLLYEIHEALVWHRGNPCPERIVTGNPELCALRLTDHDLKDLEADCLEHGLPSPPQTTVSSTITDDTYLNQVHTILTRIREGTFYQLNLLRWFKLQKNWNWQETCARVAHHGGPFSSLFRHGNTCLASLSPEQFLYISRLNSKPTAVMSPIKGTIARNLQNQDADEQRKIELAHSPKDAAELHMIVDLIRNDLTRICRPLTVQVQDPGSIISFHHVHHLQAKVSGELDTSRTMGEIFRALCPGGSITGTPKTEVMKHIRSLEGRDRGYMMGNAFIMDADGAFDSSILIRTIFSADTGRTWEYAAGSGIVIKSDPDHERQEIIAKCRPITD